MTAGRPRAARAAARSVLIAAILVAALLPGATSQAAGPRRPDADRPAPAAARDSLEQPGTTSRASVTSREAQADGTSNSPAISADGRYVVFLSDAPNLGANPKAGPAVVLRDRVAGTMARVAASRTTVSTDYVEPVNAYRTDLMERAAAGQTSIWVRSVLTVWNKYIKIGPCDGLTEVRRVTKAVPVPGEFRGQILYLDAPLSASCDALTPVVQVVALSTEVVTTVGSPTISGDGRWVAFTISGSTAGLTQQTIAFWDRTTRKISGMPSTRAGTVDFAAPALSYDGRFLAFQTQLALVPELDSNENGDVYVLDRGRGRFELVSAAANGRAGLRGDSASPAISADGNWVAFRSFAAGLAAGTSPKVPQVYLRDRASRETTLVSHRPDGDPGTADSGDPSVSSDGRVVVFSSRANDLVAGDGNNVADVFAWDRASDTVGLVSVSSEGTRGNDTSRDGAVAADGRSVAFASMADNLVPRDTNGGTTPRENPTDVFVHDLVTGRTSRISIGNGPKQANGSSGQPAISATGRWVAFASTATNLVSRDTNRRVDVFLRDRPPAIRLAENPTDFGTVAIGTPGLTRTITATSTGATSIWISGVGRAGADAQDFLVAADGCTRQRLYPGERCQVQVLFTPSAPGAVSATARFTTDAPSRRADVALRANVRRATFEIEPKMGPPGTVVVATGTGFPANSPVDLRWSLGITPVPLEPVYSDDTGRFVAQVLVLRHDRIGRRNLVANVSLPGTDWQPSKAAFLVVPGSGTPPTSGVVQVWEDTLGRPILLRR